jgi:hypothetical protein
MSEDVKTVAQIARMIRGRAEFSLGPWPHELEIVIFLVGSEWKCGLSPARYGGEVAYREEVLRIATDLQQTIRVVR